MKYKEIKVYTTHEKLDDLIELFAIYEEIGIEISEEDRPHVTFYVPEGESVPEALAEGLKSPEYEMISAVVDDQDWLHKWEEYYVPTRSAAVLW